MPIYDRPPGTGRLTPESCAAIGCTTQDRMMLDTPLAFELSYLRLDQFH